MEYKYKISIVVPFYNSEIYLEDVITSIINQSIGFKNIQLILVNDGSNDNSEKICLKYENAYENVFYFYKENGGVSSARNLGLEHVEGKYVNFIDSDDIWDKDAILNMYNFMEENYLEIDFASARVKNFEANNDYHFLDYKFEKTRVIDIEKEPDMLILHAASSLFKSEAIKNRRFDTRLVIGEDCVFVNTLLLDKLKYGVVREAGYNYRKRNVGNSAIQNIYKNRSYFFETPKYSWNVMIDESNKKYNKVIAYIQNVLLYELKWRINCNYFNLNCLEVGRHIDILRKTATNVEDEAIDTYRLLDSSEREILRNLKEF